MTAERVFSRRALLLSGAAIGAVASNPAQETAHAGTVGQGGTNGAVLDATGLGLTPGIGKDQSSILQAAIDQAVERGVTLLLPPGRIVANNVVLRAGARIMGAGPASVLAYGGGGTMLRSAGANDLLIRDLVIDGGGLALDPARVRALIDIADARGLVIDGVRILQSGADGIALERCAGRIAHSVVTGARDAGIFSIDADMAAGSVEIADTHVRDCRDNGILIWRSAKGEDGSRVTNATVARIGNKSGGSGQYGNGVNVFRASNVSVSGCNVAECAYSAIRGNAADNFQVLGNRVREIGEVAIYAEFGFSGAVIANNVVDGAATGIAVTNFDRGGRLAVVQGNLVRNLRRREHEPADKRGEGIAVEADAAVSGNVIEGAPTAGLLIGWGKHMRDVAATGNVVRDCGIGIGVSTSAGTGRALIANNIVSGSKRGGIAAMDHHAMRAVLPEGSRDGGNVVVTGNVVS